MPVVVATMSSSRIIKSAHQAHTTVGVYAFQQLNRAAGLQEGGEQAAGFVPMGIFDSSELAEAPERQPEIRDGEELSTVTLTEEELQRRLTESFDHGLTEGKNLAERGLVNVFRSLRLAAEGVKALREKVMRESEDDLIDLIKSVARKVILREVTLDRSILHGVVQAAIAALSERCEITIRLNPDDYVLVMNGPDETFRTEVLTERMRLKSDPAVLQGSCMIDSEMGTLDAGVDGQLDEIFRRMLEQRALPVESE